MGANPRVNQMKAMDPLHRKMYIKHAPKRSHAINFTTLNIDFPYIMFKKSLLRFMSSLFLHTNLKAPFGKKKKKKNQHKLFGENKKLALTMLKRKFHEGSVCFDCEADTEGW